VSYTKKFTRVINTCLPLKGEITYAQFSSNAHRSSSDREKQELVFVIASTTPGITKPTEKV
jgi:hypothetical protein